MILRVKATVFVDDAVLGHLPDVCAKTGEHADGLFRIDGQVRSPGRAALLLLLFLGPIGWIILLFAWIMADPERVHTRIPYSNAAVQRERHLARSRTAAAIAAVVLLAIAISGGLAAFEIQAVWTVLAAAAVVLTIALQIALEFTRVHVSIDGSRRWITLSGVHPAFAAAVKATQLPRTGVSTPRM
jgi:fatty acid desaturase